jgi:hypothetical protein
MDGKAPQVLRPDLPGELRMAPDAVAAALAFIASVAVILDLCESESEMPTRNRSGAQHVIQAYPRRNHQCEHVRTAHGRNGTVLIAWKHVRLAGHRNLQSTARCTALAPDRFAKFWRD